jgi:hypothetical protein
MISAVVFTVLHSYEKLSVSYIAPRLLIGLEGILLIPPLDRNSVAKNRQDVKLCENYAFLGS